MRTPYIENQQWVAVGNTACSCFCLSVYDKFIKKRSMFERVQLTIAVWQEGRISLCESPEVRDDSLVALFADSGEGGWHPSCRLEGTGRPHILSTFSNLTVLETPNHLTGVLTWAWCPSEQRARQVPGVGHVSERRAYITYATPSPACCYWEDVVYWRTL